MKFTDCFKLVVKEHAENKSQIVGMAMKDLKKQYSGTVFGMLWPVLKNLIFVFAYWFTITIGLKSQRQGLDFPDSHECCHQSGLYHEDSVG